MSRAARRAGAGLALAGVAIGACGASATPVDRAEPNGALRATAGATTTTTATTVAARAAEPRPRAVRLTIAASGDFLIHSPVFQRAKANAGGRGYDFAPMFRLIRPYVRDADLALCHVETPMTPRSPSGYPIFNTPPALARAIASTGWDACDTASNHTLDLGQFGIDRTIAALRRAGISHTGSARSARAARRIVTLRVRGVRVAFLAYTDISNGQAQPHPWSLNRASPRRILSDARRARKAGADVVVVNVHWGDEYQHTPSAAQLRLARVLTRSPDVTAIIGQHVHVVQPIRRINGKLVVFGQGNLVSNQSAACCAPGSQDGLIALLRVRAVPGGRARVTRVDYVPVWVRRPDYAVVPVWRGRVRGLADPAALRASWRRTVGVVGRTSRYAPWTGARP
jgi:poly-gamma-glutamate synthesis protein (capsule biosynthesis protein)